MTETVKAMLGEASPREFMRGLIDSPAHLAVHVYVKVLPTWDWSAYGEQAHEEIRWYMDLARSHTNGWSLRNLIPYLRQHPAPTERMQKFLDHALAQFQQHKGDRLVFGELPRDLQVEPFPSGED